LLEPVAPLRGIVVNDSGEPVPNASIFLGYPVAPDGGGIPGRVAARTDANGKFTLEEYPGALSIVSASHLGYAPSFVGIGVEAARTSPIRLTLNRGGRMEGVVSYGGIPLRADQLCFVTLYIGGEMYEGSTRTGDGGAYTHETLPVGENLISVGFHEHGRRYIQRLVTIRENETVYENFDLADTYDSAMEGVVLVDGVPSETHLRAIVPFANGDVIHYQTMTSSDGNYRLSEFPAATFEFGPLAVRMPDGSFLHTEQATLTTQPGQTLRHDIHIERQ
jgi:hypothetical protein